MDTSGSGWAQAAWNFAAMSSVQIEDLSPRITCTGHSSYARSPAMSISVARIASIPRATGTDQIAPSWRAAERK